MKLFTFTVIGLCISFCLTSSTNFKSAQLKNSRVQTAYKEKEKIINQLLEQHEIEVPHIFLRAFKKEQIIELWAKHNTSHQYQKITSYKFCQTSGNLGPKRRQGDGQIPEGFYHIDRFNPWSNFYLSLGINYPNASDVISGDQQNPGGDIFIHGSCVTIGCIPITDDKIKALYVFAVEAKNNGQENIPVHIFPSRMTAENYENLINRYKPGRELLRFWDNLKEGFAYFDTTKTLPEITIDADGLYYFQ